MFRRLLLAVLLLLVPLGFLARAETAGRVLGKVADKRKDVYGQFPNEKEKPLEKRAEIKDLMKVWTRELSAVLIAIGDRSGAVSMGPETRLTFNQRVVDFVNGAADNLGFFVEVGRLRFVFIPKPQVHEADKILGAAPGQIVIRTPKTLVTLYGTDVYLTVAPNGDTAVYVAEGAVAVRSTAVDAQVRIEAGQWTQVVEDKPPTAPASFRSGAGLGSEPQLGGIDQSALPDPFLHLLDPRPALDLPR